MVIFCVLFLATARQARADDCQKARMVASLGMESFDRDPAAGLAALRNAADLCPQDRAIRTNLALALYRVRQKEAAYAMLEELAGEAASPGLLVNLGWMALDLDKTGKALDWSQKALGLQRTDTGALALKVAALLVQGDREGALQAAWEGRDFLPDHYPRTLAGFVVDQAWQTYGSGEENQAIESLTLLAEDLPDLPEFARERDRMVASLLDDSLLPEPRIPPAVNAANVADLLSKPMGGPLEIANLPVTMKPGINAYGLFIGIGKYRYFKEEKPFAAHDAEQMMECVTRVSGFGRSPRHLRVLTDREADLENTSQALDWVLEQVRARTRAGALIYFSGRVEAVRDREGEVTDLRLLLYGQEPGEGASPRFLSLMDLKKRIQDLKNSRTVVIIDGCGREEEGCRELVADWTGTLLLSLCPDCRESAYGAGRQGAFTYALLRAFTGQGDLDHDGWVDSEEAFAFAKKKARGLGAPLAVEFVGIRPMRLAKGENHGH